ncbi:hypothetical protein FH972_022023 [Carpinus fangiana]|uniref:Uncharacterized protein n=1 Tax=Carpinus fangiana TaxID=176857 RepID=A0A5N6KRE3_9ROSI|nr:hypothetical protein FH972_022023 [Carpinus fangiana]
MSDDGGPHLAPSHITAHTGPATASRNFSTANSVSQCPLYLLFLSIASGDRTGCGGMSSTLRPTASERQPQTTPIRDTFWLSSNGSFAIASPTEFFFVVFSPKLKLASAHLPPKQKPGCKTARTATAMIIIGPSSTMKATSSFAMSLSNPPCNSATRKMHRTKTARSTQVTMNKASEATWKERPATMMSVPVCTVASVSPTEAIAPPAACRINEIMSQVTKTMLYMAGRMREKCTPYTCTRRARHR